MMSKVRVKQTAMWVGGTSLLLAIITSVTLSCLFAYDVVHTYAWETVSPSFGIVIALLLDMGAFAILFFTMIYVGLRAFALIVGGLERRVS
ncbi:hypothetical protein [Archaeoglobus sp.]